MLSQQQNVHALRNNVCLAIVYKPIEYTRWIRLQIAMAVSQDKQFDRISEAHHPVALNGGRRECPQLREKRQNAQLGRCPSLMLRVTLWNGGEV